MIFSSVAIPAGMTGRLRRVRSLLSVIVTVFLACAAIASLFVLHDYAGARHEAEATLLTLSEQSVEHGQLEWQVLAEGKYDATLDAQHMAIHGKIDATKARLAGLIGKDDPRYKLVVARYDDYHNSIADVFKSVKQGKIEEAKQRDEALVRPRFQQLQDALQSSLKSLRGDAKRADRLSLFGTLGALGLLVVLVLYWRYQRQRQTMELFVAEQRGLQRSEARFRRLVQGSSDVVLIIDGEGHIVSAAPSVEQVFGYEPEQLQGQLLSQYVADDDHEFLDALIARAAAGQWTSESVSFRLASPTGKWFHVESAASNLLADPDVGGIVLNSRDATHRRFLELQLKHRAFHDPLTGLANRTLFAERVGHSLVRSVRRNGRIAVVFIDLDDFKLVNDSMGHSIGDELLVGVAERMDEVLRPEDTACRMGGDEFAILLEDVTDEEGVRHITERVIEAIVSVSFELGGRQVGVGATAGVAIAESSDTPETVLRNADLAMYSAKAMGKGRVAVYDSGMHRDVVSQLELKAGMMHALETGQFYLDYQPIVALSNQMVVGAEALVRWQHPERGVVPPMNFVSLAEETGFIVPLGRFMLREACKQAAYWATEFPDQPFVVNVNISPIQLTHGDIVQGVAEALADANLHPSRLVLEITESSLVGQSAEALQRMSELRELGVRLAVDDFGTGYSSLFALQNFPIDILKIDKAFVDALGRGKTGGSLTEAILGLADVLNVRAVAEGIETFEQLDDLIGMHCEYGQGFLFARPLPASEISRMLQAERNHRFRPEPAPTPSAT